MVLFSPCIRVSRTAYVHPEALPRNMFSSQQLKQSNLASLPCLSRSPLLSSTRLVFTSSHTPTRHNEERKPPRFHSRPYSKTNHSLSSLPNELHTTALIKRKVDSDDKDNTMAPELFMHSAVNVQVEHCAQQSELGQRFSGHHISNERKRTAGKVERTKESE
ncbi:hypothetical protein FRC12_008810 [Ceratobasidium sp. 428]|nr:hypothetical protein FRC12_008810 [Ceratobasidium sp. 428]